jgi:hypothetical protein
LLHGLARTIGAFRLAKCVAGQHHRGRSGRVGVVRFAKAGTALPFGTPDFANGDALRAKVPGQAANWARRGWRASVAT